MNELPEPPPRVLARVDGHKAKSPCWWNYFEHEEGFVKVGCNVNIEAYKKPYRLIVIDHPKNDAAAVALIEQARAGKE